MWQQVERVVDDLRPLIHSVGVDAVVEDVIDEVVTLRLVRTDAAARPDMGRLRNFVTREIQAEIPDVRDVVYIGDLAPAATRPASPQVTWAAPEADADTVVLTLDRAAGPPATTVFDDPNAAAAWPLAAAALRTSGVASVIARAERLIVARADGVAWDDLLPRLQAALIAAASQPAEGLRDRVQDFLDTRVNPAIAAHGGTIDLLDVRGTDIYIHMGGGCQGCSQSTATLRQGVEQQLREAIPELGQIYDTTDHAAGENPYYRG
jgi:Fe-S cluster biogenesis protein NfuA